MDVRVDVSKGRDENVSPNGRRQRRQRRPSTVDVDSVDQLKTSVWSTSTSLSLSLSPSLCVCVCVCVCVYVYVKKTETGALQTKVSTGVPRLRYLDSMTCLVDEARVCIPTRPSLHSAHNPCCTTFYPRF